MSHSRIARARAQHPGIVRMRAGEQDLLSSRGHALVHRRSVRAHAYLLTRQSACSVARRNATRGSTRRTKEVCSHRRRRRRRRRRRHRVGSSPCR